MRLARHTLLLAALLAPMVTASIARAQANDQNAPKVEMPGRAGQITADDIIDRMSKAERAVLGRLRTSQPLMEVYIQHVAPDEARGWVPVDDNYFLGQLQFDDEPRLRPLGRREQQRGMVAAHLSLPAQPGGCLRRDGGARLAGARAESDTNSNMSAGSSSANRGASSSTSNRSATARGFVGRIWIEDRDYTLVRFNGASHGSEETLSGMLKRTLSFHMDGWRVNVAPGVWVPSVRLLGRNGSEQRLVGQVVLQDPKKQQARFRSQTRIWRYQAQNAEQTDSLTTIRIDEPHVADTTAGAAHLARTQPAPLGTGGRSERPRTTRGHRPARAGWRSGQGPRDRPQQPRGSQTR